MTSEQYEEQLKEYKQLVKEYKCWTRELIEEIKEIQKKDTEISRAREYMLKMNKEIDIILNGG